MADILQAAQPTTDAPPADVSTGSPPPPPAPMDLPEALTPIPQPGDAPNTATPVEPSPMAPTESTPSVPAAPEESVIVPPAPVEPAIPAEPTPVVPPVPSESAPEPAATPVPAEPTPPTPVEPPHEPPAATTASPTGNKGNGGVVAAVVGIFLLMGAVTGGVIYSQQNQDIRSQASQKSRVEMLNQMPKAPTGTDAKVGGYICSYNGVYKAGTVFFYNVDQKGIIQQRVATGQKVYTMAMPTGSYAAFFAPDDINLPVFAYTNYVRCENDPDLCMNHDIPIMDVQTGSYGNTDLCDPQFTRAELPDTILAL